MTSILSTVDGTNDYYEYAQQYVFDSSTTIINVRVVSTLMKYLSASLSFTDASIPRVTLSPDYIQIVFGNG